MKQAVHELTLGLRTAREPFVVKKKEMDQCESLSVTRLRGDVPPEVRKLFERELKHIFCEVPLVVVPFTCSDLPAPFIVDLRKKDGFQADILVRTGLDEITEKYACVVVFNPKVYALSRVRQQRVMASLAKKISLALHLRVSDEKMSDLFSTGLQFKRR
jgi:hypothetical protein